MQYRRNLMNRKDRKKVFNTIGQDWLEFILNKILKGRAAGLLWGVLMGWSVAILVLAGVYNGDTIELPGYAIVISAVFLGSIILAQVWIISRLTYK
jgi:hypothetical protein